MKNSYENLIILTTVILLSVCYILYEFNVFRVFFKLESFLRNMMFFFCTFFFFRKFNASHRQPWSFCLIICSLLIMAFASLFTLFIKYFDEFRCNLVEIKIKTIAVFISSWVLMISALLWMRKSEKFEIINASETRDENVGNSNPIFFLKTLFRFKILIILMFFNQAYWVLKCSMFLKMNSEASDYDACLLFFQKDSVTFQLAEFQSESRFIDILTVTEYLFGFFFCYTLPTFVALGILKNEIEFVKERSQASYFEANAGQDSNSKNIKGLKFTPKS